MLCQSSGPARSRYRRQASGQRPGSGGNGHARSGRIWLKRVARGSQPKEARARLHGEGKWGNRGKTSRARNVHLGDSRVAVIDSERHSRAWIMNAQADRLPISIANTDRALSPRPWPGERLWRLATMSMRDRSVSTSCCALPLGVGSISMETPPLSSTKRGCCRPARRITFSNSPNAMERRSSSRATHSSNNRWKRDRG